MRIRTASKSDAEAITEVQIAAIREAYCDLWPADELARIAANYSSKADVWREHLGSWTTLVAEVDGDIAGYVSLEPCEDEETPGTVGTIAGIYVRPEERGLGIGQALMREAMARSRDRGLVEVYLWVLRENRRAVDFFERLGFRMNGVDHFPKLYSKPVTRVRLRRLLEESE
jgi:ribosomal protein S18 acetylase RimI-like enzyme